MLLEKKVSGDCVLIIDKMYLQKKSDKISWDKMKKGIKGFKVRFKVGFKVRVVITDDRPSNVNAFTRLHEIFDGDNKPFIKHLSYADNKQW